MSPETFEAIKKGEMEKGLSEDRATRAAGAEYWRRARAKYKERRGGKA